MTGISYADSSLRRPGYITAATMEEADGYEDFTGRINELIASLSINEGKTSVSDDFDGKTHVYEDSRITCMYKESYWGNDHYMLCIRANVWDDLPEYGNERVVFFSGWNFVYHYQDGLLTQKILQHIPGNWVKILDGYKDKAQIYW